MCPPRNAVAIRELSLSVSEEQLALALANGQLYTLALSSGGSVGRDEAPFTPLTEEYHSGEVRSLDRCVRKPLVASCGADRSIRIWNYLERTCELSQVKAQQHSAVLFILPPHVAATCCRHSFAPQFRATVSRHRFAPQCPHASLHPCLSIRHAPQVFHEECHSIAFHPSGLHVLCGFSDKLRLMNVLVDGMRTYRCVFFSAFFVILPTVFQGIGSFYFDFS